MRSTALPFLVLLASCTGRPTVQTDASAVDASPDVADATDVVPTTIGELPIHEMLAVPGLDGPVDVVVDHYGWPHIYATTLHDAAFVQGILIARDRMAEMVLLDRAASGTLAEVFGSLDATLIEQDLGARVIGMRRAAQATWDALQPGRARTMLEAYSAGVNQYLGEIRLHRRRAPTGTELAVNAMTPDWTPVDSLTLARLQAYSQSYDADQEIEATHYRDQSRVTFDMADATANPLLAARHGFFWDLVRFASPVDTTVVGDFFTSMGAHDTFRPNGRTPQLPPALFQRVTPVLRSMRRLAGIISGPHGGSNNWVVDAAHSSTHHAMLENDPHMTLPEPSIWWGVHVTVTQGPDAVDFAGVALPGAPGIVIGFNQHVAWGLTNAFYDAVDEFQETVTPGAAGQPDTVHFNGHEVPIQTLVEHVADGLGNTYDAPIEIVPQHGPILPTIMNGRIQPRTGTTAISVHWVGMDPTREIETIEGLIYSHNATEARTAMSTWSVPAMNFVFADTDGAIAYSTQSAVPIRAPGARTWDPTTNRDGTIPCFVLPGTGEAEWTGMLDASHLPNVAPGSTRGIIVTANNDQVGQVADNNPLNDAVYLGSKWALGFRAQRITERLTALGTNVSPADMVAIQSDHRIAVAARIRPFLDPAFVALEAEWSTPGTHPELSALATRLHPRADRLRDAHARLMAWSLEGESGVETSATDATRHDAIATTLFHGWLVHLLDDTFSDEIAAMHVTLGGFITDDARVTGLLLFLEHPELALTRDTTSGQSVVWDDLRTAPIETRDAILLASLDEAMTHLATTFTTDDVTQWLWGNVHTIRFASLIPGPGSILSIPTLSDPMFPHGFPRWGGFDTVDAAEPGTDDFDFTYGEGPSQRFSVEMDPAGPRAVNALPGGESVDNQSPHHADEAALWRIDSPHPVPFLVTDVVAAAEARLHFDPM